MNGFLSFPAAAVSNVAAVFVTAATAAAAAAAAATSAAAITLYFKRFLRHPFSLFLPTGMNIHTL